MFIVKESGLGFLTKGGHSPDWHYAKRMSLEAARAYKYKPYTYYEIFEIVEYMDGTDIRIIT